MDSNLLNLDGILLQADRRGSVFVFAGRRVFVW